MINNKDKKISIWRRLYLNYDFKYRFYPRNFVQGIKNLVKWFPIIWADRDWDDAYLFYVMKFKITNMSKYIGYKDRHVSAKRDAEIMMTCVRLMDRVQDEYYIMENSDYHKSDFNFIPCDDNSGCSKLEIDLIEESFDDYFKKYPLIYKKVTTMKDTIFENKDKSSIAMNIGHMNHDRARKLLFKILEGNIERWWD